MTRRLVRVVEWSGVLLGLVILAALWLASREETVQWVAREITARTGGAVVLDEVHGTVLGSLTIGRARYQDADLRISAAGVELEWDPIALLFRPHGVRLERLEVERIEIESLASSEGPSPLPDTLRLPMPIALDAVRVGQLAYISGDMRIDARELRFAYAADAVSHRLDMEHGESALGIFDGRVSVGTAAPYPVDALLSLKGSYDVFPYRIRAKVEGPITAMRVTAANSEPPLVAQVEAVVTPFAAVPLREATATAESLDLRAFGPDLPAADLKLELSLRPVEDGRFAGDFRVVNRTAGTLDRNLVPIAAASGRFQGAPGDLVLSELAIDLGAAGQLRGSGGVTKGQLHFDLNTPALNLRGIDGKLVATRLAGAARLRLTEDAQKLTVDLSQQGYRIEAEAERRRDEVEVRSARVRAKGGELAFTGRVALGGRQAFGATGTVSRFDPAAFGDFPTALLNGSFTAAGSLSPQWEAAVTLAIADTSRFRGAPLAGGGTLDLAQDRIGNADITLRLGANRLEAKGSFGKPGDRLVWSVEVTDPKAIDPRLAGRFSADGTIEGTLSEPAGAVTLAGKALGWGRELAVAELKAAARMARGIDGEINFTVSALEVKSAAGRLERASVAADGTLGNHEIELAAAGSALDASARVAGTWSAKEGWVGRVTKLESRGAYPIELIEPAPLAIGPDRQAFGPAALRIAGGRMKVNGVRRFAGILESTGEFTGIPAAFLQQFAGASEAFDTTLLLGGKWELRAADRLNGRFEILREKGDILVRSVPPTALGLTQLALSVTCVDDRLRATFVGTGDQLGTVNGEVATLATRRGNAWAIPGTAPLKLAANANIPSIRWLQAFTGDEVTFGGALDASVVADGTVAAPDLRGTVSGAALELGLPEHGVFLGRGTLRGTFEADRMVLDELVLRGGDGTLTASGVVEFAKQGTLTLNVVASRLELLSRPGQKLTVSGHLDGTVLDGQFKAQGKLTADSARIEVIPRLEPTLSSDIVVKGREAEAQSRAGRNLADLDLELDLGKQFFVNAFGLDGRLAGSILLRARGRELPKATGSIRVVQGYYTAFGQRLSVDRGILTFAGPIDNPGINALALRKNQAVEAGVAVTGSLRSPNVRLVSIPEVPDTEKLSWLLLGRAPDPSARDNEALTSAAASLLAEGGSSLLGIQGAKGLGLGLDSVGIRNAGGTTGQVASFGKRISDNVYLSYERSVSGAMNLTRVRYVISPRWSVEAATGTIQAVDGFLTIFFD